MNTNQLKDIKLLSAVLGLELFGQERSHIEVYKSLAKLGAQVLVGVSEHENGGDVGHELRNLGFETFPLPFGPQWSLKWLRVNPGLMWRNPLAVLRCSYRFSRMMKDFRPTHIMLGNPLAFSYLSLSLLLAKVPLIYRSGDAAPTNSKFNYSLWKCALWRADRVVAISEFIKRDAESCGVSARKISVIYNLAPSSDFASPLDSWRRPTGVVTFPRLVYVGNILEEKGLVPLIKALAILARQWPTIELDIAGKSRWDSQFRERLMALLCELKIENRVNFLGFVANPRELYRRGHVHVAPSLKEEPLGNVVLEAKREGVPSVVFRSGGLPEMVRHHVDGVICTGKTPEALAAGIGWLLEDRERLRATGCAAQADFLERFAPERFARQWAGILSGL